MIRGEKIILRALELTDADQLQAWANDPEVRRWLGRQMPISIAEALVEHGVEAEVVDLRTIAPLDMELIEASVEKTGRVVVVEEGTLTGGIGAEIVARVTESCFDYLQAPPKRVAAADCPVPSSRLLEQAVIPDFRSIAQAVAEVVGY